MNERIDSSLRPRSTLFFGVLLVSRLAFIVVAALYLWKGLGSGPGARPLAFGFLLISLPLVWFPVQAGSYVGWRYRWHEVNNPSPPLLVVLLGWALLLSPLWLPTLARALAPT